MFLHSNFCLLLHFFMLFYPLFSFWLFFHILNLWSFFDIFFKILKSNFSQTIDLEFIHNSFGTRWWFTGILLLTKGLIYIFLIFLVNIDTRLQPMYRILLINILISYNFIHVWRLSSSHLILSWPYHFYNIKNIRPCPFILNKIGNSHVIFCHDPRWNGAVPRAVGHPVRLFDRWLGNGWLAFCQVL